jgi:hypothetical protein
MRGVDVSIAVALGLVVSLPAIAQNWAKETNTMFGIKLGAPIASSSVPQCAPTTRAYGIPSGPCYEGSGPYSDRIARLWGLDALRQIASSAYAYFHEGSVESIGVDVKYNDYQTFKAILLERYGPPTKITRSEVMTGVGTKIPIETLEWNGRQNTLILIERSGQVDQAQMLFSNNAMREKKHRASQDQIKEGASKF